MTITSRRILVTEDDMARLRGLVRTNRGAARRDQKHLEELDRELDHADIAAASDVPSDVVTMHSVIRIRDLDTGTSVVYRLVFPADADIERGLISVLAPMGTALIGYRVGDRIEWAARGGTRRLEVEAVLYQPETAAA